MNPTTGTVNKDLVWERREHLKDKWKAHETLFEATDLGDEEEAVEAEFTTRNGRYSGALASARGLLESTGPEATPTLYSCSHLPPKQLAFKKRDPP